MDRLADIEEVAGFFAGQTLHANTLASWVSYAHLMRQYGEPSDGEATALMIGALAPLSARSFDCFARQEYGAGQRLIVDPFITPHKALHATFLGASGLALPLRAEAESVDSVHTNQLLHMLYNPSNLRQRFGVMLNLLLWEIACALKPGGQLCMVEVSPRIDFNAKSAKDRRKNEKRAERLRKQLQRKLGYVGMSEIHVGNAMSVVDTAGYLFDATRDAAAHGMAPNPSVLSVFARK